MEMIWDRLDAVVLRASTAGTAWTDEARFELEYEWFDGDVVLSDVAQTDAAGAAWRQIARFEYAPYPWGPGRFELERPVAITRGITKVLDGSVPSLSAGVTALQDITGDGLPDVMGPALGTWSFAWEPSGSTTRTAAWVSGGPAYVGPGGTNPGEPLGWPAWLDGTGGLLDQTMSFRCRWVGSEILGSASYTMKRYVDVDGDGYRDLLLANQLPSELDDWVVDGPLPLPLVNCALPPEPPPEPDEWTWTIYRGGPGGWEPGVVVGVPTPFPRVGHAPVFPSALPGTYADHYLGEDGEVDLLDMDGDGWLDVVKVVEKAGGQPTPPADAHELVVYFHSGGLAGGWEDVGVSISGAHAWTLEATLRSLQSTWQEPELSFPPAPPYEPTDLEHPTMRYLDAFRGLVDVNGDGFPDFVDTGYDAWSPGADPYAPRTWQVWLGTGSRSANYFYGPLPWWSPLGVYARTDEGGVAVEACETGVSEAIVPSGCLSTMEEDCETYAPPEPDPCNRSWGEPQLEVVGLLDMDADGRPDLVNAEQRLWWRNTGTGFAPNPMSVPAWFRDSLGESRRSQVVFLDTEAEAGTYDEDSVHPSMSWHETTWAVRDVNFDGLPDGIDLTGTAADGIWYSPTAPGPLGAARPGVLVSVEGTHGATTELAYGSSAWTSPCGVPGLESVQELSRHHTVVEGVRVADPVTNNATEEWVTYADGVWEGGRFQGFGEVERERRVYDATVHGGGGAQPMSRATTTFALSRDAQLPTSVVVSLDEANPVPVPVAGSAAPDWRPASQRRVWYAAHTEGGGPGTPAAEVLWSSRSCLIEYSAGQDPAKDRSSTVSLVRDTAGNVLSATHRAATKSVGVGLPTLQCFDVDAPEDTRFAATWVGNADGTLFVPTSTQTSHWDMGGSSWILDESGEFAYDGQAYGHLATTQGLLTRQRAQAGGSYGSEEWWFFRTPRGALFGVDAPGLPDGRQTTLALTYGDALPALRMNHFDHQTSFTYDRLGRQVSTMDPNGVVRRTEYDGLGRVAAEYTTPANWPSWYPQQGMMTASYAYIDSPAGSWVDKWAYRHTDGTTTPAPLLYRQLLDGFGAPVENLTPAGSGTWIAADTVRDAAGAVLRVSYPRRVSTLPTTYTAAQEFSTWNDYDGLGRPRSTWSDYTAMLGGVAYDYSLPRRVRTEDAEGYQKSLFFDSRRRLVSVAEGRNGVLDVAGRYEYDARGRPTRLYDANGNEYRYVYDLLGRLRQVYRKAIDCGDGPLTCPELDETLWYSHEWEGPDPVAMWEGAVGTGTLVATWDYDALGRLTEKRVLDRTSLDFDVYTWGWDAGWLGAKDFETDPAGSTSYFYNWLAGSGPAMGLPDHVTRFWSDQPTYVANFWFGYDLDGNLLHETWPSDTTVSSMWQWDVPWAVGHQVWYGQGGHDEISYERDPLWGLDDGWTSVGGANVWDVDLERSSPTQVDAVAWNSPRGSQRRLEHVRLPNGMLAERVFTSSDPGDVSGTQTYFYDDLQRVSTVAWTPEPMGMTVAAETYAYDPLGNITELRKNTTAEIWQYERGPFSQVTSRDNAAGFGFDAHTYDALGRLSSWTADLQVGLSTLEIERSYGYDGAGRLTETERRTIDPGFGDISSGSTTYDYDAHDNLVREHHSSGDYSILRFGGFRYDTRDGSTIEELLPMLSAEDGSPRWTFRGPDGQALETYDANGDVETTNILGAYGMPIETAGPGQWAVQEFHGRDADEVNKVVHMGRRHMLLRDGLWLQPEPLLYMGPAFGDLTEPRSFGGVYAMGNPVRLRDPTGFDPADDTVEPSEPKEEEKSWGCWLFSYGCSTAPAPAPTGSGDGGWGAAAWKLLSPRDEVIGDPPRVQPVTTTSDSLTLQASDGSEWVWQKTAPSDPSLKILCGPCAADIDRFHVGTGQGLKIERIDGERFGMKGGGGNQWGYHIVAVASGDGQVTPHDTSATIYDRSTGPLGMGGADYRLQFAPDLETYRAEFNERSVDLNNPSSW